MNGTPEVEVGGVVFKYAEIRTGSRRIKIWTAGEQPVEYKLRPEPHGRDYDRNQPQFYLELATAIGTLYNAGGGNWPPAGTPVHIDVVDDDFTLEDR